MSLSIQHPAAPGAYLQRYDQPPPTVALRTDIAGFVGIAERGPVGVAVAVESIRQFQAVFGSYIGGGFLAYSRARVLRERRQPSACGARRLAPIRRKVRSPRRTPSRCLAAARAGRSPRPVRVPGATPSRSHWSSGPRGQASINLAAIDAELRVVPPTSGFAQNSLVRLTQAGGPVQVPRAGRHRCGADSGSTGWIRIRRARTPRQYPVTGFDPSVAAAGREPDLRPAGLQRAAISRP